MSELAIAEQFRDLFIDLGLVVGAIRMEERLAHGSRNNVDEWGAMFSYPWNEQYVGWFSVFIDGRRLYCTIVIEGLGVHTADLCDPCSVESIVDIVKRRLVYWTTNFDDAGRRRAPAQNYPWSAPLSVENPRNG